MHGVCFLSLMIPVIMEFINLVADVTHIFGDDGKQNHRAAGKRSGKHERKAVYKRTKDTSKNAGNQKANDGKPSTAAHETNPAALRERFKSSRGIRRR